MKKKKKVDWENVSFTNTVAIEALVHILEQKGVLTKDEVLEEIKRISKNMAEAMKGEEK